MVSEKLDFVIRLARVTGAELAEVLRYDVSYISRIRTGKRTPPEMDKILEQSAQFFAKKITTQKQKEIAQKVILGSDDSWPLEEETAAKVILEWFNSPSGLDRADAERVRALPRAKRKSRY